MKKIVLTLVALALVLPIAACTQTASAGEVKSDKPRVTPLNVSSEDKDKLAEGNSEFAFDLYRALKGEDGNLFYSPYSISAALAMTWAGARNETERQMADTLHFYLTQGHLHPAFNYLDMELDKRGEGARGKDDEGFRLSIVNAIWGQKGYSFLPDFLDTLALNYGAGLRTLDFAGETEKSRVTINDWVSEQTEERIKDLIPQGMLDPSTRLVLTNAIYFNAAWLHKFNEYATAERPFYLLDGSRIDVPMMNQTETFGYTEGEGYQALELPYDGNEISMVILLPERDEFRNFEEELDFELVNEIIGNMESGQVDLTMPKFTFESEFNRKKTLTAMGMPVAFSGSADFSGMTGQPDLYIDEVIHKAFVLVDETGTEAAAATAVVMKESAMPMPDRVVTVDSPFIFLIRDIETEAILFIGRVLTPEM